jgi:hypothetical protein
MPQDQTAPPAAAVAGSAVSSQTATTLAPPAASGPYTSREMYEAAQLQRRVLSDQLSSARSQRDEVAREIRHSDVAGVDKAGLEQRLQVLDTRVLDLQGQLADAQQREAQAAAVPGSEAATQSERYEERTEVMLTIGLLSVFVVLFPLVLMQARRLWKKHSVVLSLTPELNQRLDSIERAVEATAIEIERVGEGQRFVTQLLASRAEEPVKMPRQNP